MVVLSLDITVDAQNTNGQREPTENPRPTRSQSCWTYSNSVCFTKRNCGMARKPSNIMECTPASAPGTGRYSPVVFAETAGTEASQISAKRSSSNCAPFTSLLP